ncbi:hypothetical protein JST97_33045 [bacterium]|nr:hypothetical protein [bacterium]
MDARRNQGYHVKGDESYRYMILNSPAWPKQWDGLDLGNEAGFFQKRKAKLSPIVANGIACQNLSLNDDGYDGTLMLRKDTGAPFSLLLRHGHDSLTHLFYRQYHPGQKIPESTFAPPGQVAWQERPDFGVDALYWASPGTTLNFSHFPVPFAYSDWEAEVVKRYTQNMIAARNEQLREDLPPCKPLNGKIPSNPALPSPCWVEALTAKPEESQWSLLTADSPDPGWLAAVQKVARLDPNPTDRAFALQRLVGQKDAESHAVLREALFSDNFSLRLLALELLAAQGDTVGDAMVTLPNQIQHPFQLLFCDNALQRLHAPNFRAWMKLDTAERVKAIPSGSLSAYLTLAESNSTRPAAALALYVLGTPSQAALALPTLTGELLAQGKQKDEYHSEAFYLRGDIIKAWRDRMDQAPALKVLLRQNLDAYSPEREPLLIALGYSMGPLNESSAAPVLARFRTVTTDNYDFYTSAALSLAQLGSTEAYPSLLHVLKLQRHPFSDLACDALEELTNVQTPGKPKDMGVLHNLGLPKEELDLAKASAFWENWLQKHPQRGNS